MVNTGGLQWKYRGNTGYIEGQIEVQKREWKGEIEGQKNNYGKINKKYKGKPGTIEEIYRRSLIEIQGDIVN